MVVLFIDSNGLLDIIVAGIYLLMGYNSCCGRNINPFTADFIQKF